MNTLLIIIPGIILFFLGFIIMHATRHYNFAFLFVLTLVSICPALNLLLAFSSIVILCTLSLMDDISYDDEDDFCILNIDTTTKCGKIFKAIFKIR